MYDDDRNDDDDDDDDDDAAVVDDDDDNDVDVANDGMMMMMMMMRRTMMRRMRMKMKMRMMTLHQPEISSRGGLGRDRTWACRGTGSNWKASGFPMVLVSAYSLLEQEQLQLAQLVFVKSSSRMFI